jgi:hypothetical protein
VAALKTYEERDLPSKFETWLAAGALPQTPPAWQVLEATELKSKAGATFKKLDDGSYLAEGKNGSSDVYTFVARTEVQGLRALRLEAMADPSMTKGGPGRADNGNIGLSRIRVFASSWTGEKINEIKLVHARASFEQNTNTLSIASALDNDPKTGWAIDPHFGTNQTAIFDFDKPLGFSDGTRLEIVLEFELNTRHNIGRPRLAVTSAEQPALDGAAIPASIAAILERLHQNDKTGKLLSSEDRSALLNWWKNLEPGWQSLHAQVEAHARQAPKPKLTKVLVCAEGYPALRMNTQGADFFNQTYFLQRGSTDLKGEVATPGFLQVLMRDPSDEKRWQWQPPAGARFSGRRRALANWMTDVEHGAGHLLARVEVNRLWQHHFGQGLVATPNDFGAQGAKPVDPGLLDYLATELIRNGWRLKPIHQLIMTSAVYQQGASRGVNGTNLDSTLAPLMRGAPQRLEAEAIRDSLLFVSGVLDTNMFGPGTLDESSRRRSIYFTVKRSRLIPEMQSFDTPEPLVSQGSRPVTTVAPQALMLMNNPNVRSWSAAFVQRFAPKPSQPLAGPIRRAYSLALNRQPTEREQADGIAFIEQQTERYESEQKPAARELALTDFAQVLLSLNEFIYVE